MPLMWPKNEQIKKKKNKKQCDLCLRGGKLGWWVGDGAHWCREGHTGGGIGMGTLKAPKIKKLLGTTEQVKGKAPT